MTPFHATSNVLDCHVIAGLKLSQKLVQAVVLWLESPVEFYSCVPWQFFWRSIFSRLKRMAPFLDTTNVRDFHVIPVLKLSQKLVQAVVLWLESRVEFYSWVAWQILRDLFCQELMEWRLSMLRAVCWTFM